jgi:hypothetical protein
LTGGLSRAALGYASLSNAGNGDQVMKVLGDVEAYLKTQPLKYVVHLKMLTAYSEQLVWYEEQVGDQTGVMLLLPTSASPFDAKWNVL